MTLEQIYEDLTQAVQSMGLAKEDLVFSGGDANAEIMLIGEAPGKEEVLAKKPFVGKAGKNLDFFLELLGEKKDSIFITNAVKYRPFKVSEKGTISNRTPTTSEVLMGRDYLAREIAAVDPRIIVTLGNTALFCVTGDKGLKIGEVHGQMLDFLGERKLFPLYHPASIIYRRELKNVYEEDILKLKKHIATTRF